MMDNKKRINTLINKVIKSIEQASILGNTNKILSDSEVLKKLQIALSEITKTELLVSELENTVDLQLSGENNLHVAISSHSTPSGKNLDSGKNSKYKGKSEREKILIEFENQGVSLIREGRSDRVYMRGNGQTYGIAYSAEFKKSPRWWLGLPVQSYDVIVLICEKSGGDVFRFIFPDGFYQQFHQYFSQSNGEYKFNIFYVNNQWEISMNEMDRINITEYINNYDSKMSITKRRRKDNLNLELSSSTVDDKQIKKYRKREKMINDYKPVPLKELIKKRDLIKLKPDLLIIEEKKYIVQHWTDVDKIFVEYLIDNRLLSNDDCPIYNSAGIDKYFINTKPIHENPNRDHYFKKVRGVYVDTKYNANGHVKNYINALKQLNINNITVKIRVN